MRTRLLFLAVFFLIFCQRSFAQIVGTDVFLQGQWLEIGEDVMGAFGTCTSPATYHTHGCCGLTPCLTAGSAMDASYDWAHDGGAGAPNCRIGPYTIPGYPQEGWGIEVNLTEYRNWAGGGICTGSFNIAGSITGYSNTGGTITGTFSGAPTAGPGVGLNIIQESRVDTYASWVVVTTRMYNTTAAPMTGVYYERTCDPDNTTYWGGGPTTENVIVHQNEDARHDVMIGTYGSSYAGFTEVNSWMALATKDCRAKCGVLPGLYPTNTPSQLWAGTGTVITALGDSNSADEGIFLVYNIGTIAAGDSAVVSYSYIYDGRWGMDSAFPDPTLVVDGSPIPTAVPPTPTIDTFNSCSVPGLYSIPVSILYGTDKDWTWSTWTWAPSTGLASTTGVNNTVNVLALTGPTTYTITGTDTSVGSMLNCNVRVYLLTVIPCHAAHANAPCLGEAIYFGMTGDSVGASYSWTGPGGFTSFVHDPVIFPSSWADTGLYRVAKTIAGVVTTDSIEVTIHPLPTVVLSSNAPLCAGVLDTLVLSITPVTPGETFSWTGPDGFMSTLDSPIVPDFNTINIGNYTAVAVNSWGCRDSATIYAGNVPPPAPPPFMGPTAYCYGATFIPFFASGSDVLYYSSIGGAPISLPSVNTSSPGTYTYYATQSIGSCISPADSITILVNQQILPDFSFYINRGCNADTVTFTNISANCDSYAWYYAPGLAAMFDTTAALLTHQYIYAVRDTYRVTLVGYNGGDLDCQAAWDTVVDTRHNVIASFASKPDTFCLGVTDTFYNYSVATLYGPPSGFVPGAVGPGSPSYPWVWNFGDGLTDSSMNWQPWHIYSASGLYTVRLTVYDSIGCPATDTESVYVMQLYVSSFTDTTLCLGLPLVMANHWWENPVGIVVPQFTWTQSSPNLSDTSIDSPLLTGFGTFVDTLMISLPNVPDIGGLTGCAIYDTITINSVSGNPVTDMTASGTISYGSSIQLNADNEVLYYWTPNNGTLNNPNINDPIATPSVTTTYTVYGTDIYGCLDSASVTIYVDSSETGGMPEAFTPNNDGLNDIFRIPPGADRFSKMVEFRVFNRWGTQVFYTNNISNGWDGKYMGVPQDMGVYFYEIVVATPGGENITYKGDVTLIR